MRRWGEEEGRIKGLAADNGQPEGLGRRVGETLRWARLVFLLIAGPLLSAKKGVYGQMNGEPGKKGNSTYLESKRTEKKRAK